jgi:hypothetical protein
MRKIGLLIACTVCSIAVAVAAGAAAADPPAGVDEHRGLIETEETNCFETADRRPVLWSQVDAYVPDTYQVTAAAAPPPPAWLGPADAVVANVGFTDYVCESVSVNGHRGVPTIVSMGTVAVTRNGVGTSYVLWVGTDNPLLYARLQQLGVEAYFIPRSSYSKTVNAEGQTQITVEYVGTGRSGLDYTRTITVLTDPPGQRVSTGTFYHLGRFGEVRFVYANRLQTNATATVCFDLEPGSLPTEYGITNFPAGCFPSPRALIRGSWSGTIELLS